MVHYKFHKTYDIRHMLGLKVFRKIRYRKYKIFLLSFESYQRRMMYKNLLILRMFHMYSYIVYSQLIFHHRNIIVDMDRLTKVDLNEMK